MRNMTAVVIMAFAILSLGGWICLAVGARRRRRSQATEEAQRGRATGRVTEFVAASGGGVTRPVVEFTAEGQVYRLEAPANPEGASVGDSVEVRYDPDDPARFRIESGQEINRDGRGLVRAGVAWVVVAAVLAAGITALPRHTQFWLQHALSSVRLPALFEKKEDRPERTDSKGEYDYQLAGNGLATIAQYNGSADSLTVPLVVDGHAVSGLSMGAFRQARTLVSVKVPGNISAIPIAAFAGCISLREVELGEGVASIGAQAFGVCPSLHRVSLPASLSTIADDAFQDDCGATFQVPRDSFAEQYCRQKGFTVEIAE